MTGLEVIVSSIRSPFRQLKQAHGERPHDAVAVASNARFRFNDSAWPIVVVTLPADLGALEEFRAYLDQVTACHERGRFALVVDARTTAPLSSTQRHLLAAARSSDEERLPGVLCARAGVVVSDDLRRSMEAVSWLCPPSYPYASFSSLRDAIAWAAASLARADRSRP